MQDVIAYFSSNGQPALELAPTIRIRELVSGSPNSNLVVNNEAMDEVGDGYYTYHFVGYDPRVEYAFIADGGESLLSGDRYAIGAAESPDPEENADAVWDSSAMMGALDMKTLLETLLKYQQNRTKVDPTAKTLTVYDSDGLTPLKIFNLKDSAGNPSLISVYEKMPL